MKAGISTRAGVRKTLRPGEAGTRRFVEEYGDRLVCVRRREDATRLRRYVTVELVVKESAMSLPPTAIVGVRVRMDEPVLRQRVKVAGGVWNARARLWELPYGAARALSIEDRIVGRPHLPSGVGRSTRL